MGKPVECILLTQLIELLPFSSENLFLMLYKIFLRASGNKRVCISLSGNEYLWENSAYLHKLCQ